jgi:hypothetical protein
MHITFTTRGSNLKQSVNGGYQTQIVLHHAQEFFEHFSKDNLIILQFYDLKMIFVAE